MEPLFWLVIAVVLLESGVDLGLDLLQLKRFAPSWPKSATLSFIDDETFTRSQAYQGDKKRFGIFCSVLDLVLSLSFLALGGYALFWGWAGELLQAGLGVPEAELPEHEIKRSLAFAGLLWAGQTLVGLPRSLYSTFVVEERHGFNKSSLGLWVTDQLKGAMLSVVLGGPLLAGLVWCLRAGGRWLPLLVCAFLLVVQLVAVVIYPILIQPLFNKATPVEEGRLKREVEALAKQVEFPLTKLYQIDGSKRSSHSNAYFFGFGKNKRIVLYDTLINQSSIAELIAVLGHELGHWKRNHTFKGLVLGQLSILLQFSLFSTVMEHGPLFSAFGFSEKEARAPPAIVGLLLFSQLAAPLGLLLGFAFNWVSRKHEFEADRFAAETLRLGAALKLGLVRLQGENLGIMDVHPWYSARHFSHPPIPERLAGIGGPLPTKADMEAADAQKLKEQEERRAAAPPGPKDALASGAEESSEAAHKKQD